MADFNVHFSHSQEFNRFGELYEDPEGMVNSRVMGWIPLIISLTGLSRADGISEAHV